MPSILDILNPAKVFTDAVHGILSSVIADPTKKAELAAQIAQAQLDFTNKAHELDNQFAEMQSRVVIAEAQGSSWMQRNWRPVLMFVFMSILVNNFILAPYVKAFGANVPVLDMPPGMYALLTVCVGGYIGGRTLEKVKDSDNNAPTPSDKS